MHGLYLGEEPADEPQLKALLAPYPADDMICWPVSARVGNVRNNVVVVGTSGAGWREPTSSDQLPIHRSESPTGYSSPGRPVIKYKLGYLLYWN
jgi:hypothetical protein